MRAAPSFTTHRGRARLRGVSLIEVIVAIAIVALMAGGMVLGLGALTSARLRESSSLVASAVRVAYNHANATSRPTRLVFDFGARTITVEDSPGQMLLQSGDRTGGAAAATDAERAAVEEAEAILDGPRAPRAQFSPVKKLLGFESDKGVGKTLSKGIYFRQIEVAHDEEAVREERVYLYFWPGGQTERAAIQLQKSNLDSVDDRDIVTLLIAPLTGKVRIVGGPVDMARPRSDEEASERDDFGI